MQHPSGAETVGLTHVRGFAETARDRVGIVGIATEGDPLSALLAPPLQDPAAIPSASKGVQTPADVLRAFLLLTARLNNDRRRT